MYLKFFILLVILINKQLNCQQTLNNFNDDNQSNGPPHSRLLDVQFSDNDTRLAINFENVNEQQLPFYLHCEPDYKFNMEQFTEDFVQIKYINLINTTEHINTTISLKKVQNKNLINIDQDSLVHYQLLMNSTRQLSNFCWNLTFEQNHYDKRHYWYGAPANLEQHWPIDSNLTIKEQPYITSGFFKNSTGSLVEYVWFSTTGFLVFVERDVPLFISLENGILCLKAKYNSHPYNQPIKKTQQDRSPFKAHIIISKNIKDSYLYYLDNFVQKPKRSPNPLIYSKYNIWSTWVKFKRDINQNKLIEFAKNISSHGFTKYGSIFEIDDKWEDIYSSFKFDKQRFPNAKQMVNEIKSLGFNLISVWTTPFISNLETIDSEDKDLMVKELNSSRLLKLKWWNGNDSYIIDPSNPRTRRWFMKRIKKLFNEYNIDTFKADAGEISWMRTPFKLFSQDADLSPNKFSEYFSLMISNFENSSLIELRTGFNSQKHGNLIRILDKDSNWSYDNGFKSLIPSCLTYSILGYPFLLPDMVGGNAYDGKPDKELYIRWLAVNSLLPVMQYSIAPFDYDEETIKIALKFQELHNKYVPLFVELSESAKQTGQPIIRPLWWIEPTDEKTWTIDNQFLIGNNLLVAPILEQNQTARNIYLPKGQWYDELRILNITGPKLLENYQIKLDEIAYFTKIQE